MVKTKKVISKEPVKKKRPPMADVHTEVKPSGKTEARAAGDWWNDIMSGETCRVSDEGKIVAALTKAFKDKIGLNIQMYEHAGGVYYCYITRIMTEQDTIPPSQKRKRK